MKYNMQSLDIALDHLLPKIAQAKVNGINFNRVDLCRMVATQQFINEFKEIPKSYNDRIALYIVAESLVDLEDFGLFKFGDRDAMLDFTFKRNNE